MVKSEVKKTELYMKIRKLNFFFNFKMKSEYTLG